MRKFPLILLLLLVGSLAAQPRFNGFLQNWTAYNLNDDKAVFLLRNRFRLNTTLPGDWVRGYASLDFSDEHQNAEPYREFNLRELYFDLFFERFDLRIGKQQVIWGKADGVFINDIVNPLDLRHFLMQDFDDIRQGSMMIKGRVFAGNWGVECLFIPKFEPWKFAEPGSPWEFYRPAQLLVPFEPQPDILMTLPIAFNWETARLPAATGGNGELGIKISGFTLGTDISLMYLNSYQDNPVANIDSITMQIDFIGGNPVPQGGELYLTPYYLRTTMYGFNFSRPVGGLIIRGEVGYFDDYNFNLQPAFSPELLGLILSGNPPPVFENLMISDYLQVMVGVDISGPWGSGLSGQYIRKQVLDYNPAMLGSSEIEEMLTLMISGTFWNEEASLRWLTLYDKNTESGLSRLTFGYKLADAVQLETGIDILWGEQDSFIGQFAGNDNAYLKLIYSF